MRSYTKSRTEISGGMVDSSGVHCLPLIFVCIFLLQAILILLPEMTWSKLPNACENSVYLLVNFE